MFLDSIPTEYYVISFCFILIYDSNENNRVITCIRASVNPIFIANSSLWIRNREKKKQTRQTISKGNGSKCRKNKCENGESEEDGKQNAIR